MPARWFSVGRLDQDSEGLLILTNDGAFAQALAHPRHRVSKTYHVWTDGRLSGPCLRRMRDGIPSDGEILRAAAARPLGPDGGGPYEVVLREGRKRQIRRMVRECGRQTRRLKRVAIGPLEIGDLAAGAWRPLTPEEIEGLRVCAGQRPESVLPNVSRLPAQNVRGGSAGCTPATCPA
jgi:23S rRNA pseudouridine2605 synthase